MKLFELENNSPLSKHI